MGGALAREGATAGMPRGKALLGEAGPAFAAQCGRAVLVGAAGATLILTTHYMEEAEELCDRIIMMSQGNVIADGSMASLGRKHKKLIAEQQKKTKPKKRGWTLDNLYVALTGSSLNE